MAVIFYGWEGYRRSGSTLAMHHRLEGANQGVNLQVQGLSKGDEHPINTSYEWQSVVL